MTGVPGAAFKEFWETAVAKPNIIKISAFISEKILPHHLDSEKFRELAVETTVQSVSKCKIVLYDLRLDFRPPAQTPDTETPECS